MRKISVRFGIFQPGNFGMKKSRFSEQQIAFILKQEENVRLKRLVANLSLDKEMLQDVIKRKL